MKNTDIESLLRDNKPQVKDNPAFLLEVQQKMRAVDGIKSEVDRQRRHGRQAIVYALFAGFILGCIVTVLAYIYPVNPESIGDTLLVKVKTVIDPWKQYILFFVAACAVALGVVYSKQNENAL